MKLNKKRIIQLIKENEDELTKKYPLKSIALYGSFARGDQKSGSDVDILVEFSAPIGMEVIDLTIDLENILENKVDLVTFNAIKNRLFPYIKNELIYV